MTQPNIDEPIQALIGTVADRQGSDLIFGPGLPPMARIHGHLTRLTEKPLSAETSAALARALAGPRWEELQARRELEFSFSLGERARIRANLFYQRGSLSGVLRIVPYAIPSLEEIGAPPICTEIARRPHGLVLVTGPSGSGKSTTLAAMIDRINRDRAAHIVTVEDPIEYVHKHRRSIVMQRELGTDTLTFAGALRSALRENPDVVLVGEMRDLDTMSATLTMAETGHLVFATLHTNDAGQAIDRMVDVFPPNQQPQVQVQLSQTLLAVIHQQLLPRADGNGRVAAFEVMVVTPAVRNLIKDGKTNQLRNVVQTSSSAGMHTLESDLRRLILEGMVLPAAAYEATSHPTELEV
jgi:twitching motility protein PilT